MLGSRAAAAAALLVASAGLLSGCFEDESKADPEPSSAAAPLPDNLCEPVLGAVSSSTGLSEDTHRTEGPTAVCELTGPGDTSLRVTLTDLPDREAAAAALDLVCRTAVGSPVGGSQRSCELASERVAGQPFSSSYAASYAATSSVVVIQFETADDTTALLAPAELTAVEAALQER